MRHIAPLEVAEVEVDEVEVKVLMEEVVDVGGGRGGGGGTCARGTTKTRGPR